MFKTSSVPNLGLSPRVSPGKVAWVQCLPVPSAARGARLRSPQELIARSIDGKYDTTDPPKLFLENRLQRNATYWFVHRAPPVSSAVRWPSLGGFRTRIGVFVHNPFHNLSRNPRDWSPGRGADQPGPWGPAAQSGARLPGSPLTARTCCARSA